jgi:hypothetical protein
MYHNSLYTTAPQTEAMYLLDPGVTSRLVSRNNLYVSTQYVWVKVNTIAVDADYDLLYTTDPTRLVKWLGTPYATLAALRSGTGQELHGLVAAPQLVAPAAGDFRPVAGSAAIDHGVILPGIDDDYVGGAPDIGAVEYDDRLFADGFGG